VLHLTDMVLAAYVSFGPTCLAEILLRMHHSMEILSGILWDFEQDLQAPYCHTGCIHGCVDIMLPHSQSSKMRQSQCLALSSQTCAASSLIHNCREIGVHCTYSCRQHISCASFGKRILALSIIVCNFSSVVHSPIYYFLSCVSVGS
jgi:hypothetical protein